MLFRFESDESLEATGFNCRIVGVKRNESLSTAPTPSPPTTTPKPLVCPIANQQYCSCGRVKSSGVHGNSFNNFPVENDNIETSDVFETSDVISVKWRATDLSELEQLLSDPVRRYTYFFPQSCQTLSVIEFERMI